MLRRGHTTVQRQEGESETEGVRIPSVKQASRRKTAGEC